MKLSSFLHFASFGVKTILFRKKDPILGTIILTDKCNLKCKHCSVNNITAVYMKNSHYDGGSGAVTAFHFEEDVYHSF